MLVWNGGEKNLLPRANLTYLSAIVNGMDRLLFLV